MSLFFYLACDSFHLSLSCLFLFTILVSFSEISHTTIVFNKLNKYQKNCTWWQYTTLLWTFQERMCAITNCQCTTTHWKCPRRTCTAKTSPYLTQLHPEAAQTVTFVKQMNNCGWILFFKSATDRIAVNPVRAQMRLTKHREPCASLLDLYIYQLFETCTKLILQILATLFLKSLKILY